jgi:hypothetical protein
MNTRVHLVVTLGVLTLITACGGTESPTSPTTPTTPVTRAPSNATIQNAINAVIEGFTTAFNNTYKPPRTLTLGALQALHVGEGFLPGAELHGPPVCTRNASSCSIAFHENFSPAPTPCANGGSQTSSMTLNGVLVGDDRGTAGTLNLAARMTFAGCSMGGAVTNTPSSIGMNGSMFFTHPNRFRINQTISGSFDIMNAPGTPAAQTTCVFNSVIHQYDSITGTWAYSGSIDCNPGGSFRWS